MDVNSNGWKSLEITAMAGIGWKLQEWLEIDRSGWTWLEMAENG